MNIPYGRQCIDNDDIEQVVEILKSDWLTQGPAVEKFEEGLAKYCGISYAVAVNSATSALHIACMAAGLSEGKRLWTTPNSFVASANCGLYCGASVDFVDIDNKTYNMSTAALADKLERAARENTLPHVIIPVHFAGQACDMKSIYQMAKRYDIVVIEDASHAIGGWYEEEKIGNCRYSDMTVFSFHPVKIITSGEGGAILTQRPDFYDKLIRLRSHGITRSTQLMTEESHGAWYYQQLELGYNYRMTDIQAALGASQLTKIERYISRRKEIVAKYNECLKNLPIALPWQNIDTQSAWHLYVVRVHENIRKQIFDALRQKGIGVNVHYIPIHTQPYYQRLGFRWGDFPVAEQYYRETLSLPIYYGFSDQQQEYVIQTLSEMFR